ncbi:MAG: DUF2625 domain-containing protein [Lachnospiraceae bacterium]|nr:DUF2625 domain-containing protein [Lachnospiraceae bacterium]
MKRNDRFQKILDDIKKSTKMIKILPSDRDVKKKLSEEYPINPESLLGLLLENTGGIIIDNWLRFYGTGEINFIIRNWLIPFKNIVIAEDILGGLFMYLDNGNVGYFAPDCLELEDMGIGLRQFLYWCLHGDTDTFYIDYRWKNWQDELSSLDYDKGVAFYPFLWAEEESLESRWHSIVPMKEIIGLEFEFLKQMQKTQE